MGCVHLHQSHRKKIPSFLFPPYSTTNPNNKKKEIFFFIIISWYVKNPRNRKNGNNKTGLHSFPPSNKWWKPWFHHNRKPPDPMTPNNPKIFELQSNKAVERNLNSPILKQPNHTHSSNKTPQNQKTLLPIRDSPTQFSNQTKQIQQCTPKALTQSHKFQPNTKQKERKPKPNPRSNWPKKKDPSTFRRRLREMRRAVWCRDGRRARHPGGPSPPRSG